VETQNTLDTLKWMQGILMHAIKFRGGNAGNRHLTAAVAPLRWNHIHKLYCIWPYSWRNPCCYDNHVYTYIYMVHETILQHTNSRLSM
jgi:hypothetical protein